MVHKTAIKNAQLFFDTYVKPLGHVSIIEIGSQDVNGGIRQIFAGASTYTGVDFADAAGVDVVLEDPYKLPFDSDSFDVVLTSSCFEHSEFFWETFTEAARVLRPGGLFYLNAPSQGPVHGYPVDCWRFYPDAGRALAKWATRQGQDVVLLESFITHQDGGYLNDFVAVFAKDSGSVGAYPNRIQAGIKGFENGYVIGETEVRNKQQVTEDQRAIQAMQQFLHGRLRPV